MVEKLLVPIADEMNEHKQLQLRSLAAYNGTLRDENYGRGGRRFGENEGTGIVCGFCGEPSHPTSDCPERSTNPLLARLHVIMVTNALFLQICLVQRVRWTRNTSPS